MDYKYIDCLKKAEKAYLFEIIPKENIVKYAWHLYKKEQQ